jgi:hypothetical protein
LQPKACIGKEIDMGIPDLDIGLTDEQKNMRDMVRRLGTEVVRPAGIELDRLPDPADVIAKGSDFSALTKGFENGIFHR